MKHSHTICRFPNKISIIDIFEKFKSGSDQALTLPKKVGMGEGNWVEAAKLHRTALLSKDFSLYCVQRMTFKCI